MKSDTEKTKRGELPVKAKLNNLLQPLEPKLKTILGKMIASDGVRAKIVKSLEKRGSLARMLVKDPIKMKQLIKELKAPVPISKRDAPGFYFSSVTGRAFAAISEGLGILGAIIFIIILFPFLLVIDIIQFVFAIIIFVSWGGMTL